MSTASVIVIIVCLLAALVCFAFVNQTIATKREQRARVTAAMKARARNFSFILNGFPDGFISKDLTTLVQRSLVDVLEQLTRLEPKEDQHLQNLQLIRAQMNETQRASPTSSRPSLENPQQIKEVRVCLEELHKFIYKLEEQQTIPRNVAKMYRNQIKELVLHVSVDNYRLNAMQARQSGKVKLALHYFELALNLIVREQKTETFRERVESFKESIAELKEQLCEELRQSPISMQEQAEREETEQEWEKYTDKDADWKKKNVYD